MMTIRVMIGTGQQKNICTKATTNTSAGGNSNIIINTSNLSLTFILPLYVSVCECP